MTMSSRNTEPQQADHPHYAWLREQLDEAQRDGDQGLVLLLSDGLEYAQACNAAWHRILEAAQGNLIGMEVVDKTLSRYAAILQDASEPGRFRAQFFDANGFSGHATYNTPEDVLERLVQDGYREPAVGAMNTLSQSREWSLGTLMAHLIAKVNAGKMTYREMQDEMHAADARLT